MDTRTQTLESDETLVKADVIAVTKQNEKWSEARVFMMQRMWREGRSGSEIAYALGGPDRGYTRNAVIGKIHRLGVADRPPGVQKRFGGRQKTVARIPKPRRAKSINAPVNSRRAAQRLLMRVGAEQLKALPNGVVEVPLEERRNIMTVTKNQCRWCYGDPVTPDFHFCHHDKIPGLQYCELHAAKVYISVAPANPKT